MIELRYYQQEAKEAFYDHLRTRDDNPCIVIPTAGGKTPIIASICKDAVGLWGGRVMILAHVKELLEQTEDKLRTICPEVPYGIYSAGLRKRQKDAPVIIAGIQSVHQRACEFDPFDLILVDEAHLIPPDGDGMYRRFLTDARVVNPNVRIGGLTATPYRLKTGNICGPGNILNHVCYEIGVRELIDKGFLSRLTSKAGKARADTSGVHVQAGEFVAGELEALVNTDELVDAACKEIVQACKDRKAVLVFACGITHGDHVTRVLRELTGEEVNFVTGDTETWRRDEILDRFKEQDFKWLVNVSVLTTGFDAPHIDCVVLLRPTLSPGLYYQMVGRGFRTSPDKENCLVLDFGGNVMRHGPVDAIQVRTRNSQQREGGSGVVKECPQCAELIAAGHTTCPLCGFVFPDTREPRHDARASSEEVLSGVKTREVLKVSSVTYHIHIKKGAEQGASRTLRVDYHIGWHQKKSEWVCLEHSGFARNKAVSWWIRRSNQMPPKTIEEAVDLANRGALAQTLEITVEKVSGEKFDRVTEYKLGPIPTTLQEPEPAPELTTGQQDDWAWISQPLANDALDFPFGANDDKPLSFDDEEIPF